MHLDVQPLLLDTCAVLQAELGNIPLSEEWVAECIAHLCARDASLLSHTSLLHHSVRAQLMASDLVQSMDHASLTCIDKSLHAFVQIVGVMDVGVPAQALHDVWVARQSEPTTPYPRGMLRLELSDGYISTPIVAYEYERIPSLSLDTCLGTKLLLLHPMYEQDALLLTPSTVRVLGGTVPEMDSLAELAQRIGSALGKILPRGGVEQQRQQSLKSYPSQPSTLSSQMEKQRHQPLAGRQPEHTPVSKPQSFDLLQPPLPEPTVTASDKHVSGDQGIDDDNDDDDDDVWLMDAEQVMQQVEHANQPQPQLATSSSTIQRSLSCQAHQTSSLLQRLESSQLASTTPSSSHPSSSPPCMSLPYHTHTPSTSNPPTLIIPKRGTPTTSSQPTSIDLVSSDADDTPVTASTPATASSVAPQTYITISSDSEEP